VAQNNYLVMLGITPTYPATGYGYIQQGELLDGEYRYPVYEVKRFKEKPDEQTPNSCCAVAIIRGTAACSSGGCDPGRNERQMPGLFKVVNTIAEAWGTAEQNNVVQAHWYDLKSQTIDYGVMEKAEKVAVLPASGLGWSDVGSWDSLFDVLLPDMNGNVSTNGQHLALDTNNTLVYTKDEDRLVVTIGLDDMVVVTQAMS
jgi:mannose-1-phosphate guanylyltransferase